MYNCDMCAELCTYGGTVALTCTLALRIEKLSISILRARSSLRHFTLSVQLSHEETALRFLWIAEPRNICPGSRAPEKRKEKEYERWKRKMGKGRRGRMGG